MYIILGSTSPHITLLSSFPSSFYNPWNVFAYNKPTTSSIHRWPNSSDYTADTTSSRSEERSKKGWMDHFLGTYVGFDTLISSPIYQFVHKPVRPQVSSSTYHFAHKSLRPQVSSPTYQFATYVSSPTSQFAHKSVRTYISSPTYQFATLTLS